MSSIRLGVSWAIKCRIFIKCLPFTHGNPVWALRLGRELNSWKELFLENLYTLSTTRLVEQLFYFNLALKSLALKSWSRHIPGNALDFWYASGTALMVAKLFKSLLILWPSLFYRLSSWDVVYLNASLHICKFSKRRFEGVCGCQKILTLKLIFHSKDDKIYT